MNNAAATFYFDSTGASVIAVADRGTVSLLVVGPRPAAVTTTDDDIDLFAILDAAAD